MIKNERQYRITRAQAERFARTLDGLREMPEGADEIHPMIAQAQVDAVTNKLADLDAELREYEALREGRFQMDELEVVAELPALLIKARIAQGLSQRDLADRVGLKEQQIQRYEATDYATAKWSRIREVACALTMGIGGPTQPKEAKSERHPYRLGGVTLTVNPPECESAVTDTGFDDIYDALSPRADHLLGPGVVWATRCRQRQLTSSVPLWDLAVQMG